MIQDTNDSGIRGNWQRRTLIGVNIVSAAIGGAFGVVGIIAPNLVTGHPVPHTPDLSFFTEMYGLRSVVIDAAVTAVLLRRPIDARAASSVLILAGVVQVGDAVVAAVNGTPGVAGAAGAAAIHLGSAAFLYHWYRFTRH
ncbi:hypothetical protein [Cryobacterium sp. GrIS_2_6]|uniref:hypothetical protein n=1 Tax=Cryobacterium sp. GrIS_2_6 TaxID=3162785 RepID=UPI002DFCF800|nr:hypothetical protein [Cryobacterium psychrotolerans]